MSAAFPPEPTGLFDLDPSQVAPAPAKLSPDARRIARQEEELAAGYHPVTKLKLHEQAAPADDRDAPGRRCGSCRFRTSLGYRRKSYPKCLNPGGMGADEVEVLGLPYVSHGAGTDVRKWWPGCVDHSYGDPALSDDAARWVPGDAS